MKGVYTSPQSFENGFAVEQKFIAGWDEWKPVC